jgi:hypothetical protein
MKHNTKALWSTDFTICKNAHFHHVDDLTDGKICPICQTSQVFDLSAWDFPTLENMAATYRRYGYNLADCRDYSDICEHFNK